MNERTYREAERRFWDHYGLAPSERFVDLATVGTSVRVQEVGQGEPALFLHGSPTSGTTFAPLVGSLEGFRCVIPDLPPGGLSAPFKVTRDNARTVLEHLVSDLLDALNLPSAHLIASSSGSAFAMKAAVRAPDRVRTIVHLGSPGLVECIPMPGGEKAMLIPGLGHLMAAMRPGRRMQKSMHKWIGHEASIESGRIPDAYWDWYDALFRETGTYAQQIGMVPALKGRGLAYDPELTVSDDELAQQPPTLIMWGANDGLATDDDAHALVDRIPGAELAMLDDAGHLPWLDHPGHVAASLHRFCQAQRAAA